MSLRDPFQGKTIMEHPFQVIFQDVFCTLFCSPFPSSIPLLSSSPLHPPLLQDERETLYELMEEKQIRIRTLIEEIYMLKDVEP